MYIIDRVLADMQLEHEDNYEIGALALCNAALMFNERRPLKEFKSYAYVAIRNKIIDSLKKERRYKRQLNIISISELFNKESNTYMPTYEMALKCDEFENDIVFCLAVIQSVTFLNSRDKNIMRSLLGGYTAQEIADHYGISRQRIIQIKKRIGRKIKESVYGEKSKK